MLGLKTRQSLILFCRFCNFLKNIDLSVLQKWTKDYWHYITFTELSKDYLTQCLC